MDERYFLPLAVCGGNTHCLLKRINATGFHKSLTAYINDDGLVIGVNAGSLIFSNISEDNLRLLDTKLDVHCTTEEKREHVSLSFYGGRKSLKLHLKNREAVVQ